MQAELRIVHYLAFVSPPNFGMSEDEFVAYSSSYEPRSLLLTRLRDRLGWDVSIHLLTAGAERRVVAPPLNIPIYFHRVLGRMLLPLGRKLPWLARKGLRVATSRGILSLILRDPPDVFVFRGNMFSVFSHWLARLLVRKRIPYIYESHGAGIVVNRGCRAFVRGAHKIVVLSEDTARAFVDGYGLSPDKVAVVSNGVATDQFHPLGDRDRSVYPRMAFVGRLSRAKGFDLALDCLVQARKQWPDAVLEVAGSPWPSEQAFSEEVIAALPEADRAHVVLHGWIDRDGLLGLYRRADVMLFPSRIPGEGDGEGEPRAVLEAMATGLPVLAIAGSGGHCEIIARSGAGALADKAADFAQAASDYLEDAARVERDRGSARDYIEAKHSVEAVYDAYRRCYAERP